MIGTCRVLNKVIKDLLDLINGLIDSFELLLDGPMLLHCQCGFVHGPETVAVQPIVTTINPSVDPHLYRFEGLRNEVVLDAVKQPCSGPQRAFYELYPLYE